MKLTNFFLPTLREHPADAVISSHRLMLRAGMIRQVTSGIYTWLPMGFRVLKKVEQIVRREMDRSGALEILMPVIQPADFWKKSLRWDDYGSELYRLKDRHQRDCVLGPTHEEVITNFAQQELNSYKQLPVHFYQIQTKFRDEMRPRFGVMRSREFIMKDGYSFHTNAESLKIEFDNMRDTYCRIFKQLGLNFQPVEADNGAIGGSGSIEFHALAQSGEDALVVSEQDNYAVNMEKAETLPPKNSRLPPKENLELIHTPKICSIEALSTHLSVSKKDIVKTLIVHASKNCEAAFIALLIRGDHELNAIKACAIPEVSSPLQFVSKETLQNELGLYPGFLGPTHLNIPIIADYAVTNMSDFISGANQLDKHYLGLNWDRDCKYLRSEDLRNVIEGDPCPNGTGTLSIVRGIEVGHIFQLGEKYSKAFKAAVLDETGSHKTMHMGCYGIGISRLVAAIIEQNHDDKGIIWPDTITPFQVAIIPIKMHKVDLVHKNAERLYNSLQDAGIEVLMDDRKASLGVQLADVELLGIPHRVVISEKLLEQGKVEYLNRAQNQKIEILINDVIEHLKKQLPTAVN